MGQASSGGGRNVWLPIHTIERACPDAVTAKSPTLSSSISTATSPRAVRINVPAAGRSEPQQRSVNRLEKMHHLMHDCGHDA
jgi:hypothetical protein